MGGLWPFKNWSQAGWQSRRARGVCPAAGESGAAGISGCGVESDRKGDWKGRPGHGVKGLDGLCGRYRKTTHHRKKLCFSMSRCTFSFESFCWGVRT